MRTELDQWAAEYLESQMTRAMLADTTDVVEGPLGFYKAGFERAVKEVLSRVNNDQATYEAIEAIGQGQARDDQR